MREFSPKQFYLTYVTLLYENAQQLTLCPVGAPSTLHPAIIVCRSDRDTLMLLGACCTLDKNRLLTLHSVLSTLEPVFLATFTVQPHPSPTPNSLKLFCILLKSPSLTPSSIPIKSKLILGISMQVFSWPTQHIIHTQ